ncbi:MAG: phosphatidate cytidylyltransferase [Bacillota bacterium]|nr:phosphatidate cytidylyltransferase [Bacillota bacterium]
MKDLGWRLLTIAVGLPLMLAAIYQGGIWLLLLTLLLALLAGMEFSRLAQSLYGGSWPLPAMLAGAAVIVGTYYGGFAGWQLGLMGGLFWLILWGVVRAVWGGPQKAVAALTGSLVYLLLIPSLYAFMILLRQEGIPYLLWPVAVVWLADAGAYVFGHYVGRHPLVGALSPGKTWEGFLGALLTAGLAGWGFAYLASWQVPLTVVESILLAVVGTLGDVLESAFKRAAAVKDSGRILPGHGGIWDRFDSLAVALPLAALFLGLWAQ